MLPLLIGAVLTLLAQAVLQLRVVPRVEARKRREDRWERDVLALGELLTADVPPLSSTASAAAIRHAYVRGRAFDENALPQQRATAESQFDDTYEALVAAWSAFEAKAGVRVSWLSKRIEQQAPTSGAIKRFVRTGDLYRGAHAQVARATVMGLIVSTERVDPKHLDALWQAERDARDALVMAVEELATLPAPPRSPSTAGAHRRLRAWIEGARRLKRPT